MTEIEKTLNDHNVRPTAMRILIYKYMADRDAAIALTDIGQLVRLVVGRSCGGITYRSVRCKRRLGSLQ